MKKTILTLVTLSFIGLSTINAQVGIGTTTPDASSILDIQATDKGLLPPRMTEAERNNINSPAPGLMLWCSNCGNNGEMQVYNGTEWTNMTGGTAAVKPIQVGDFREGGVVFYIFQSTDPGYLAGETRGLVCAIQDQSTGTQWGCSGTSISTSTSLGTGNQNTINIMSGCSTAGIAARLCGDLVLN